MNRLPFAICVALAAFTATSLAAAASTIEYTFSVPFQINGVNGAPDGSAGGGVGRSLSVTCAVGPASLGYSTATNSATGATGSGTTASVTRSPATVVVTVDAEPRADQKVQGATVKSGAGPLLQPTQPNGYYTCWGTFANGQTPVNFLPTTALPKATLQKQ